MSSHIGRALLCCLPKPHDIESMRFLCYFNAYGVVPIIIMPHAPIVAADGVVLSLRDAHHPGSVTQKDTAPESSSIVAGPADDVDALQPLGRLERLGMVAAVQRLNDGPPPHVLQILPLITQTAASAEGADFLLCWRHSVLSFPAHHGPPVFSTAPGTRR